MTQDGSEAHWNTIAETANAQHASSVLRRVASFVRWTSSSRSLENSQFLTSGSTEAKWVHFASSVLSLLSRAWADHSLCITGCSFQPVLGWRLAGKARIGESAERRRSLLGQLWFATGDAPELSNRLINPEDEARRRRLQFRTRHHSFAQW